jgi:Phosphate-selective porin O and P
VLSHSRKVSILGSAVLGVALAVSPGRAVAQGGEDPAADAKVKEMVAKEVDRKMKEMEAKRWTVGVNPNGGGAFIKSPDGQVYFRLYGYAQPQFTWVDSSQHAAFGNTDFRIRRARLDFSVDYHDTFKLWIELDGAPADGTALVEAYAQAAYVKDQHYVRFGKYISPFSSENLRSSRALETVERYAALNTMFGLPALDVQIGPMLWGFFDKDKRFGYQVGVFNGNSSAAAAAASGQRGNARDNNTFKNFQARLNYKVTNELTVGGAFDNDIEDTQTLQISSYSGTRFIATTVKGKRQGFDVDAHYKLGRFAFDTEWLREDFSDSNAKLHGGYAHASYWVSGTEAKGVQAVLRGEYAQIDGPAVDPVDGKTFVAVTAGANLWWFGIARLQIDGIVEHVNGNGNGPYTGGSRWRPLLLAQFQVKL